MPKYNKKQIQKMECHDLIATAFSRRYPKAVPFYKTGVGTRRKNIRRYKETLHKFLIHFCKCSGVVRNSVGGF